MNRTKLCSTTSLSLIAAFALALAPAGCKKDKDGDSTNPDEVTANDDGASDGAGEGDGADAQPGLPEQDPDPAELATLYERLLKGEYEAVAADAAELRATLTGDTKVRANAIAASLQAMAAAKIIPENGEEPAQEAVNAGNRLGDEEILQLAHAAHAVYLIGVHEAPQAQEELEEVLRHESPYVLLARLHLAEAHLNQAFGVGEDDTKVVAPERLDDAAKEYQAVIDSGGEALLVARAHEGLAAVADYKRDKETACAELQKAEDMFAAAGAVAFLRDNISHHAGALRCKNFKAAE